MMKLICSLVLISLSLNAWALQKKRILEGGTIEAEISQNELNRVYVVSDRIKSIKSASSNFILESDEENGQVFIMPNPGIHERISLFITTELGKTIPLSLNPSNLAAQTLELAVGSEGGENNLNSPISYEAEMFQLVKAMKKREKPLGYSIEEVEKDWAEEKGLERKEILFYSGKYSGKIFYVRNNTVTLVTLEEKDYTEPAVKAIGFSKKHLIPNETAEVYVVCGMKHDRTAIS